MKKKMVGFLTLTAVLVSLSGMPAVVYAENGVAEDQATAAEETDIEAGETEEAASDEAEADAVETADAETADDNAEETEAADAEAADDEAYEYEEIFADWNEGAPALDVLIDYVETVTDESSEDYIPPVDRIAVFDMDGTLCGELYPTYLEYYLLAQRILKDPSYEPDAEMLEFGRMLRDHALDKSFPDHMDLLHATHAARAYAGMTLPEFADFVTENLLRDVDGFEGMTYAETFYLPMIEVVEYLQENDFKVYVVSGSDRFICRTFIEGMLDIPYENIIGMDVELEATNQGDTDGLDYQYTNEDTLLRTDKLLIKNLKMNKVLQIAQEIGRQPVLSFGNSGGDTSMHNYTLYDNKYKSAAFMLIADDDIRDYGNPEKVQSLKEKWEESGYQVISMKNDFRTIYGDHVKKLGHFNWLQDLAEDRIPAEPAESETEAEPEAEAEPAPEVAAEPEAEAEPAPEAEAEEAEAEPAPEAAADEAAAPEEELHVDGQPVAAPDSESADAVSMATESPEVQYVMYLGTNDMDSNTPVFTQEEAKEKVKEILVRHFGGYTIQEANGGWVGDDDKLYQEYTLVIYLSDTTTEQVYAAADELIETFHQSSVLIQTTPTKTDFYDGAK